MHSQGIMVLLSFTVFLSLILASLGDSFYDTPSPLLPKKQHFKFKKRNLNGRDVAVVTFRLDPERGRRSILPPKDARYIHTPSLLHYIPSFEGEYEGINRSNQRRKHEETKFKNILEEEFKREKDILTKEIRKEKEILEQLESSVKELKNFESVPKKEDSNGEPTLKTRHRTKKKRRRRKKLKGRNKRKRTRKKKIKKNRRKKKKNGKRRQRLMGKDACQYKILKKCARRVDVLPINNSKRHTDSEICTQRRNFLGCVEKRQSQNICPDEVSTKGNLSSLRSKIKNVFITTNSCLLSESLK